MSIPPHIPSMIELGKALLGCGTDDAAQVTGGGNNKILRVRCGGEAVALKFHDAGGGRHDRFEVEWQAMSLMSEAGLPVPRPLARDAASRCIAYQWIDGRRPDACGPAEAEALAAFLLALQDLRDLSAAARFGPASAATLSAAAVARQFHGRLRRLHEVSAGDPALAAFLEQELTPAAAGMFDGLSAATLPPACQILSPSDFGIHNCLRRHDGGLAFLDFEYFGWDDPVKAVIDALLHPGGGMGAEARARFLAMTVPAFARHDPGFEERLHRLAPLLGMIWCLIILNEFLPEFWERRTMAGQAGDLAATQAGQLRKAREKLAQVTAMCADPACLAAALSLGNS